MADISIIVPCYNVEEYIDRCMVSIINQTIGAERLEIILVDDKSTDDTLKKLCAWEQEYPDNVLVISCETNRKQGAARNVGLQYATSEYVGFVDSDDWIESNMYEILYKKITDGGYDMVSCLLKRDDGLGKMEFDQPKKQNDKEYVFTRKNGYYYANPQRDYENGIYGSINTAIYKKSIILDNNLYFPEELAYEDNYWQSLLRLYIGRMYIIDRAFYHYYFNANSTITSRNSMHHLDRLVTQTMAVEKYIELGVFEEHYFDLMEEFLRLYFINTWNILFTRFDTIPNIYKDMRDVVYSFFPDWEQYWPMELEKGGRRLLLETLAKRDDLSDEQIESIRDEYLRILH